MKNKSWVIAGVFFCLLAFAIVLFVLFRSKTTGDRSMDTPKNISGLLDAFSEKIKAGDLPKFKEPLGGWTELERSPTSNVVTEDRLAYVNGRSEYNNGVLVGRIQFGTSAPEYNVASYQKSLENVYNSSEAKNSLMVLYALDVVGKVIGQKPVDAQKFEITNRNYAPIDGPGIPTTWKDPGLFSVSLLLPKGTNSIALVQRDGEVLDRVYMEDWEPQIRFTSLPKEISEDMTLSVKFELLPHGKKMGYSMLLKSAHIASKHLNSMTDGNQMGAISNSLVLTKLPGTKPAEWTFRSEVSTLFKSKAYDLDSFTVLPSGK